MYAHAHLRYCEALGLLGGTEAARALMRLRQSDQRDRGAPTGVAAPAQRLFQQQRRRLPRPRRGKRGMGAGARGDGRPGRRLARLFQRRWHFQPASPCAYSSHPRRSRAQIIGSERGSVPCGKARSIAAISSGAQHDIAGCGILRRALRIGRSSVWRKPTDAGSEMRAPLDTGSPHAPWRSPPEPVLRLSWDPGNRRCRTGYRPRRRRGAFRMTGSRRARWPAPPDDRAPDCKRRSRLASPR